MSGSRAESYAAMSTDDRDKSSKKKASPSDVIFGQPPGRDVASRYYEQLASDGSPLNQSNVASSSKHHSPASSTDKTHSGVHSLRPTPQLTNAEVNPTNIDQGERSFESSGSEASSTRMDVDRAVKPNSAHATPSTTATSEHNPHPPEVQLDEDANVKILPTLFEDCDAEDVVALVADMLSRLTAHNDLLPLHPSALTRFHSRATPSITVLSYLRRIAKYTSLEKSCTLILLVYIDRVCQRNAGFTICSLTVHRFVCAAVVCASKALCDAFSTNGHYARVGGISLIELNMLEKEFLNIIDWKLSCSGALLQHYYTSLVGSHSSYRLKSTFLPPLPPMSPVME